MGFRINRGIFQFKDAATETFINKFKIDDRDGTLVEVDADGNAVTGYLKVGEKASDSDLLDGINSSAFLRSNTADTASARIDFTADESIRFKGARGQFTNEYIHLYNKVGIGHPSGWGQGQTDTPDKGISTYGGANFAYGNNAQSSFKGSLRVDANWGANDYAEAFTIRGTYPSIALRSTTHNAKWLIHNDNNVSWYYGSAVDTADWGLKFRIATNGNIWMSWANGWLSDLLNAKSDSSHNHSTIYAGHGYINSGDWNTLGSPHGSDSTFGGGIYRVESSTANPPTSGVYNWSLYQQGNTSRGSQIAVGAYAGGNRLFFRGSNQTAGAYRNWAEVWHTDNFDPTATIDAAKEELLNGAIATAQTTADNAATAAATAQTTADTALARADAAKGDTAVIGEIATAAQAAADAAQATADGKLGATAKAADSNLLDGINSSQFLRSDASDTMSGNLTLKYNTSNASDYNALNFAPYDDAAGINDYIIKAESSRGVFGRKSFGWHIHTNSAFGVYSNGWTKLFGVEGGTGNAFAAGNFTANNISTNQVFMQSITSDGTIANDKGSYLHLGGWAVGRTDASAVLVNTAYRADYATSLFDMNISRFTNNSGYITQSSIDTFAEEVRGEIQTAQTTADNAATAAANAQSTADGKANASHDHDRLYISDTRGAARAPSYYNDRYAQWDFQNEADTGITAGDSWQALLTVSKWSVFDPSHKQEQLIFTGDDLYRRTATSDTAWGTSKKIWDSGNFDPNTKLGATAKAADADKLDGYDWMQSGKNVRATEFYADNWFRNYNSGEGLYNQATGQHFYSDDDDYWNIAGGTVANGIRFRDEHGGTIRGYVYADNGNSVGLLDAGGNWGVRHINDNGTYFYTDNNVEEFKVGRDAVTGDYGTVQTSSNKGGWGGYSIYGQYVLMSNGSRIGIYNDIDNEWMLQCHRNAQTELYHNGSRKLYTNSGGINVEGTVTATSFSGNGSGLTNLNVPDQSIPVSINGEGGNILVGMNMNLDMGQIEFTLSNGQTFTAMMGR